MNPPGGDVLWKGLRRTRHPFYELFSSHRRKSFIVKLELRTNFFLAAKIIATFGDFFSPPKKPKNAGCFGKNAGIRESTKFAGFPARLRDGWHLWHRPHVKVGPTSAINALRVRGRSQLSTFMKAYTAYAFWWPPPPSPKAYSKMLIFSKSYLFTATCTIYRPTTHWSFHIYVNIIINKTIDIKNIHWFIIQLHAALHRSTLKRVKMHAASATCEGPLYLNPRISSAESDFSLFRVFRISHFLL